MSKNKRIVSTNTGVSAEQKRQKVINILTEHPEGVNPKFLSFVTKINDNTIKSILKKMEREGIVVRKLELRGVYVLVDNTTHGSIFDWNFHNCILTCILPDYTGERINKTYNFGIVTFEFEIGAESKQATLHISTDYPINIGSICSCGFLLTMLVGNYTGIYAEFKDISVSTMEFNQDYENLRLDGVNSISLDNLIEQFKLYQKRNGLRLEHKTKIPFAMQEVMNMLTGIPPVSELSMKVLELSKRQERIDASQKTIIDLLNTLINKKSPL